MVRVGTIRTGTDDDKVDGVVFLHYELCKFVGYLTFGLARYEEVRHSSMDRVDSMRSLL